MTQTQYVIHAQSLDWLWMLDSLVGKIRKDEQDMIDHVNMVIFGDGTYEFTIDKSWLPAEKLAKLVGSTAEAVLKAPKIVLKPLKGSEGWQMPTVPDIGRA